MDINTYSVWGRTTDTDMVLGSSPGPDIIIALVGIADHPDWQGPTAPGETLATQTMGIHSIFSGNLSHGCSRAMDPDITLDHSSCLPGCMAHTAI